MTTKPVFKDIKPKQSVATKKYVAAFATGLKKLTPLQQQKVFSLGKLQIPKQVPRKSKLKK